MVVREKRMLEFVVDRLPPLGAQVELLCEDDRGTYTLRFLGRWTRRCRSGAGPYLPTLVDKAVRPPHALSAT